MRRLAVLVATSPSVLVVRTRHVLVAWRPLLPAMRSDLLLVVVQRVVLSLFAVMAMCGCRAHMMCAWRQAPEVVRLYCTEEVEVVALEVRSRFVEMVLRYSLQTVVQVDPSGSRLAAHLLVPLARSASLPAARQLVLAARSRCRPVAAAAAPMLARAHV